jgi:predicted XRE-type DNA-binding protein
VDSVRKDMLVHRLVATAFIPNPDDKPQVNHILGGFENKSNNKVSNLEWCTPKENQKHAIENDLVRHNKGEDVYNSNLTNIEVIEIYHIINNNKLSQNDIGLLYNVSRNVISDIKNKKKYKSILNNEVDYSKDKNKYIHVKLNEKTVLDIYELSNNTKTTGVHIAKMYNISTGMVSMIKNKKIRTYLWE